MRKPYLEKIKTDVEFIQEAILVFNESLKTKIDNPYYWDCAWDQFWMNRKEPVVGFAKRSMLATFLAFNGKVYKIGEDFGKELEKVDLNIPNKFIPDKQLYCIELPDSINFTQSGDTVTTVFVMYDQSPSGQKFLCVEACSENMGCTYRSRYNLSNPEETIIDALNRTRHTYNVYHLGEKVDSEPLTDSEFEESLTFYKYIVKCLVYIGSGDPDLREYRAPKCERKSEKKRKNWERKHSDQPLIDMVFVGFDFKKERVYKKDGIWVETFPRWQRYGENLKYVKLIWVKPHPRHYKKEG